MRDDMIDDIKICEIMGAEIEVIRVNDEGEIDELYEGMLCVIRGCLEDE